jgi:alkylhydroperoxidase family enzyme
MSQRMDYNAASPAGAKALGAVHLPARLVNLVYLRVSHINGCAYCIDMAFAGPSQERAIRRTPRSRGRLA